MRNAVFSSSIAGAAILGVDADVSAAAAADNRAKTTHHSAADHIGTKAPKSTHPDKKSKSHTAHDHTGHKGSSSLLHDAHKAPEHYVHKTPEHWKKADLLKVDLRVNEVDKTRLVRDAVDLAAKMCDPILFGPSADPGKESNHVRQLRADIYAAYANFLQDTAHHLKNDEKFKGLVVPFKMMYERILPGGSEATQLDAQRGAFAHLTKKAATFLQRQIDKIEKEIDIIKRGHVDAATQRTLIGKIVEFAALFTTAELKSREAFRSMGPGFIDVAVKIWAADDGIEDLLVKLGQYDHDAAHAIETIRVCPADAKRFAEQIKDDGNFHLACSRTPFTSHLYKASRSSFGFPKNTCSILGFVVATVFFLVSVILLLNINVSDMSKHVEF